MLRIATTLALSLGCIMSAFGQQPAGPERAPKELVAFFSGHWQGAGEFANGKKIAADVSFEPTLDNQWLEYRHADRPPNGYKALGLWGIDSASHKLIMTLHDNFGGARLFTSGGWRDGKVVFVKHGPISPDPAPASTQERFSFARLDATSFTMTYEVSRDGSAWKLGDSLTFHRKS